MITSLSWLKNHLATKAKLNQVVNGYKNYETNKKQIKLVNDFHWNSNDYIGSSGIVTKVEGNLKNSNYKAENTLGHKNDKNNYEIAGAVSLLSSLHLEKQSDNFNI